MPDPLKLLIHDYAGHAFPVQLSRELARRGYLVTHAYAGGLLTPRGALVRRNDDPADFKFVEVPMSPRYREDKYSFFKRRSYEVAYGRDLAALVERLRPDLVLSGNTPTEPQWEMIRTALRYGIPVVTWLQDFYSLAVDKLARKKIPVLGAFAGAWYRHIDAKSLQASAAVVAITQDFVPILSQFGVPPVLVSVIPNWAPLDDLPLRPRHNAWRSRHGLNGKFVFLYSGTLAMKHNPDLIRALAAHFRTEPTVRVVVISEGPGADYLRSRKEVERLDNLIILKFEKFSDMPDVLAAAEVLVSVLENDAGVFSVPSKVLTYFTAGRGILGAMPAQNLATRIILQQGAGLCVVPTDIAGFITAARRLFTDANLRAECGARGRAYAETEFAIETITDRFEQVFNQVFGKAIA